MITIPGKRQRFCDGQSRRSFLKIGSLALGGMSLPDLLRAEAQPQNRRGHKSVIMIYLPGGPPHLDMFDMKPEAPREIRGAFGPIKTNVPGIEICELFPRLAKVMDRVVLIRSLVGAVDRHFSYQCLTGHEDPSSRQPTLGSVLSKVHGPTDRPVPPYVDVGPKMTAPFFANDWPSFLSVAHSPFLPHSRGRGDMVLNGITLDRLDNRKALLASLDRFRRDTDGNGMMPGMDAFTQQAFGVLTSGKLTEALDLDREDPRLRDRYGRTGGKRPSAALAPAATDNFLIARRLVEAGVRCVTVAFSGWDCHGGSNNGGSVAKVCRSELPKLDQGIAALIEDLDHRNMLEDVSVVVWGEFGRTPRINSRGGRDHWPGVASVLMAGGGMRTGQVIGATDRFGGEPIDRPVHFQDVFATLYHNVGINVETTTLSDFTGRPRYLIDHNKYGPIQELV